MRIESHIIDGASYQLLLVQYQMSRENSSEKSRNFRNCLPFTYQSIYDILFSGGENDVHEW